jgi:hypothetical protein
MIRTPTPYAALHAWHRAALAGKEPQITNEPMCGWFKRKLVKGGPFVPARIWMDQWIDDETGELLADETLQCEVAGKWADAEDQWSYLAGNPISEAEFKFMTATAEYAAAYEPSNPAADPRRPINNLTTPILF